MILEQSKKLFSGLNKQISDLLREIATDKKTSKMLFDEYQKMFNKDLIKELTSLASGYGTIYSYVKPFVETGFCEEMYQHKIID